MAKPKPPKSDEIIYLDDEEDADLNMRAPTSSKCINYDCKSGLHLVPAPYVCLSHYRVKNTAANTKRDVCTQCYDAAFEHYALLTEELKNNRSMLAKRAYRCEVMKIDDSDEEQAEDDEISIDSDNEAEILSHFDKVLADTLQKYDLVSIVDREKGYLAQKAEENARAKRELEESIKVIRDQLDASQASIYNHFRVKTFECSVISIVHDNTIGAQPIVRTETVNTQPLAGAKQQVHQPPVDLPTATAEGPLPPLTIDGIYYISRANNSGNWIKARLKAALPAGTVHESITFTTQHYRVLELKQHIERFIDGSKIAFMEPCKYRFIVGSRVIAKFSDTNDPTNKFTSVYPGLVAEQPSTLNNYRYLIFFEIGYSQYVDYKFTFQIFETKASTWKEMPPNSQSFIKKYFESVDRPMVKTIKGQQIRVEYNGRWFMCTVQEVDFSLALFHFGALNRTEWIYRGSPRLFPLYKEEKNLTKRSTRNSNVQYTKGSDFDTTVSAFESKQNEAPPKSRAVARKSTTPRPETGQTIRFLPQQPPRAPQSAVKHPEPASKIMYFTPRDTVITTRHYRSHNCSAACKDWVRHNLSKLNGHNPLAKPLLCGWARIKVKVKNKKEIVYKAPCSRMLRNMEEVHKYLKLTKSEMTVDLFDFNTMVRCLAEFNVDCLPDIKDLSRGLEQAPIPVINGISDDRLDFLQYLTTRVPTEGVEINTDPNFLVCCNCTDDCSDKSKCACWQLTLEGAKSMNHADLNSIGYVHRRLHEQVLTGIYECNSKCACQKTCLNRVVQNPMSVKLQVFQTHNRGWGIRCVNDLPQGTFICIYAGTIHTEQDANQVGFQDGDEYFAELDYIENAEKYKEDYESDVVDDDEDGEEEQVFGRKRKMKDNKYNNEDNEYNPGYSPDIKENTMRLRRRDTNVEKKEEKIENKIETVTISDDDDDEKEVLSFNRKTGDLDDDKNGFPSVRTLYGEEEAYVMDTKMSGNIGRFLNHSCSPNVFVQNVFIDTHDLRFPWVAFFCLQFIRAGTELTWNYNYDIGSVPDRQIDCQCGSLECKGRLL